MNTQLLNSVFLTDDMPATSNAVVAHPHGLASVTVVVWHFQVEDEFGTIAVLVEGSDDAENWTEVDSLEFSGAPVETIALREVLVGRLARIRVFLQSGAIAAVLGAEIEFSDVGGSPR